MLLGLEILVGAYVVREIFKYNYNVEERSSEKKRGSKQIKKCQQTPADAVDRKLEKETDHYLKVSSASLITSPLTLLNPTIGLLSLAVAGYSSLPIFKLAGIAVKEKKLSNDILNALIVIGCIATGNFFVAALAVWLFHLGSKIVAKIRNRSEKMLTDVFEQPSNKVWISKDGTEIEIPLEFLDINDIVVVQTGEVIPVDGSITEGTAMIDQQSLTGESVPAEKNAGDRVFASTLIVRGRIYIKIEKAGEETLASELSDILRKTSDFKTHLQSQGERWADSVAAPLLYAGALSFPILGASRAMAVFNSSPGNMVRVFASLQTLNHVTLASRKGILVKDGRILEELSKVDTVLFDKTGTLTQKQPKVGEIIPRKGYEKETVLQYAAIAEQKVAHPLAEAITAKARECGLSLYEPEDAQYHVGYGITTQLKDNLLRTGSLRFMEMEKISIPDTIKERMVSENEHSFVMVALNEQLIGAIEIKPQIRPEVKEIIRYLRRYGISHISIVSGDHKQPTQRLAEYLELDSSFYNILPENKANIVEQFQKEGRTVCFVGDGINDALAMKKANVSISLSGAASVATDVAQVVLMDGGLSRLPDLFDISKKLEDNLQQSLFISLGNGIICVSSVLIFGLGILGSLLLIDTLSLGVGMTHAMLPLRKMERTDENI